MANKLDDLTNAFGNACPTEELTSADKGIGAFAKEGAGKIATQQIVSRIRNRRTQRLRQQPGCLARTQIDNRQRFNDRFSLNQP